MGVSSCKTSKDILRRQIKKNKKNSSFVKEKNIGPSYNPHVLLEIINLQIEKCLCKIKINKETGTGFLCKIPFPDSLNLLPVLITNNHVLKEKDILQNKEIEFTLNDDKKKIKILINESRKTYTNEDFDTTIIEILKDDNLDFESFLEVNNPNDILEDKNIYVIHYASGKGSSFSFGLIKSIEDYDIKHDCSTGKGASGCPIINKDNYKVVGIHKGFERKDKDKTYINLGTIIYYPIKDFYNKKKKFEKYS